MKLSNVVLLLVACLLASSAYASGGATIRPTHSALFTTPDDAAVWSARYMSEISSAYEQEFIGLIYRDRGRYGVTEFQTQGKRDTSSFHGPVPGEIVAIVHNHPQPRTGDRYAPGFFSARDVAVAIALGVPSYIIVMPDTHVTTTIEIRKYIPRPSHKGFVRHGNRVAIIGST